MPTYEYQCKTCGATFDVFQSIKAAPLRKLECGSCGGVRPVRRLIGAGGGVLFKGSGFYGTDYRSEGYKKAAKAERDASKPSSDVGKDSGPSKAKSASNKTPPSGGKPSNPPSE